jgi:hypothetical protein
MPRKVRKTGMQLLEGESITDDEILIHKFLHGITDFQSPISIMTTSAMLMNVALHMYSMVINKEELQELLMHAHRQIGDEVKDTVYH